MLSVPHGTPSQLISLPQCGSFISMGSCNQSLHHAQTLMLLISQYLKQSVEQKLLLGHRRATLEAIFACASKGYCRH